MTVSPKDLALTKEEIAECDAFCEKLDAAIKIAYRPGKGPQDFNIFCGDTEGRVPYLSNPFRLVPEIENRYKNAGWKKEVVWMMGGHWSFSI